MQIFYLRLQYRFCSPPPLFKEYRKKIKVKKKKVGYYNFLIF